MKQLAKSENGISFYRLEDPTEVDKLRIGEYVYFKHHLGMSDYLLNFKSWLKRKNILFIVAVFKSNIIGWVMNERWNDCSSQEKPIFVLRGIEVHPNIKRKGIGKALFTLSSMVLIGYIITKPVNKDAKNFFSSLSFSSSQKDVPIELGNYPGYMALDVSKMNINRPIHGISLNCKNISECTESLFDTHNIQKKDKKDKFSSDNCTKSTKSNMNELNNVQNEQDLVDIKKKSLNSCNKPRYNGTFQMKSPCTCGNFHGKKYIISGKRNGILILCSECGKQRYFIKGTQRR